MGRGGLVAGVVFVCWLRGRWGWVGGFGLWWWGFAGSARWWWPGGPYDPAAFVVGLRVPGCVPVLVPGARAGDGTLWLTVGGAVARVAAAGFARGRRPNVLQAGPRSLWSEFEDASLAGRGGSPGGVRLRPDRDRRRGRGPPGPLVREPGSRDPRHMTALEPRCCWTTRHRGSAVYQSGPRRLWDELEAAYRWWTGRAARPPTASASRSIAGANTPGSTFRRTASADRTLVSRPRYRGDGGPRSARRPGNPVPGRRMSGRGPRRITLSALAAGGPRGRADAAQERAKGAGEVGLALSPGRVRGRRAGTSPTSAASTAPPPRHPTAPRKTSSRTRAAPDPVRDPEAVVVASADRAPVVAVAQEVRPDETPTGWLTPPSPPGHVGCRTAVTPCPEPSVAAVRRRPGRVGGRSPAADGFISGAIRAVPACRRIRTSVPSSGVCDRPCR